MKRISLLAGSLIYAMGVLMAQNGLTGIWYSTWYVQEGQYVWHTGHGAGSTRQMMGDVNGDGKDDAVVFFSSGDWYVALSNGSTFNNYSKWLSGHGSGSASQFLADVNGDGKADAIAYFSSAGNWNVSYSDGSKFASASTWKSGHGSGSKRQMVGDVNGDGKADAIAYFDTAPDFNGKWYVALSGGGTSCWHTGHGSGSKSQFVGDVNGDGKDDAIVFFDTSGFEGHWYVALSSGSKFGNYSQWITGHGSGSTLQTVGDANNDGKADAVIFISDGQWYVANSTGSKFNSYSQWKSETGARATAIMIANPIGGDSNAAVAYKNGLWNVLPSKYSRPIFWNLWDAWNIKYVPYSRGKYQQYDSGDPETIQEHLKELSEAKIDYLLMDETNNLYVENGIIFNRAIAVAKEIKKWNENPANRPMRYAFAIGGIQFSGNPSTLENEAKEVWNNVINREGTGGLDTYLMQNGKPLLVCYYGQESYRTAWEAVDHTWSDKFTIRWCNGVNSGTPDLYGWGIPNGSINSSFLMEVMPGWNNHQGQYVSRNGGAFYSSYCWDRVLSKVPQQVIINSYNEYAEETAVARTNTANVTGNSEKWGSADMYWNSTVNYVAQYKNKRNCVLPTVEFSVDKTQSDGPSDFVFTNKTSNGINYQWDFGDGTYSIEANPTHRYETSGVYTVTLRATGTGATAVNTKTNYITVGTTTGVDELENADNANLYFDGDILRIEGLQTVEKISVYDVQARLIGEYLPVNNLVRINNLSSGIYVVVVYSGNNSFVKKVVK